MAMPSAGPDTCHPLFLGGAHGATGSSSQWDQPPVVPPVEEEGQQVHMGEVEEWKNREGESAAGEKKQQLAQPVEEIGKSLKREAR